MKFSSLFTCIFVLSTQAISAPLTLGKLQKALSQTRSTWVAGENHMTKLGSTEQKHFLGLKLDELNGEYSEAIADNTRNSNPAKWDWRNVNGVNYVAPMLNQGGCGSCVAFASITSVETQLNITRKTPYSPWALSPQYLFGCGGGGCETGWQLRDAASFLKSKGVPDEACLPYTSGSTGEDVACNMACSDAASRSVFISNFTSPTFFFVDKDRLKAAILKGPVMVSMYVYEDFLFYKSGVYKHVTGELAGGHAVSVVGWNDADGAWIVKNSWSGNWGENGYFRIAYGDASAIGFQSVAFEVPEANGYVSTGGLRDYTVLKGNVNLKGESTYPQTTGLEWKLNRDNTMVDWGMMSQLRETAIDTTKYEDGTYQIQVAAHHGNEVTLSPPRRVHILNGGFKGSLSFKSLKSGDVVSEATKIEVGLENHPVPFTRVVLTVKNLSTGEISKRTTDNPTSKLLLYWRAQLLENGEYELQLEGEVGSFEKVVSDPIRVTVKHS